MWRYKPICLREQTKISMKSFKFDLWRLGRGRKKTVLRADGPPKLGRSVGTFFLNFYLFICLFLFFKNIWWKNYTENAEFSNKSDFFFLQIFLGKYSDSFLTFFRQNFKILIKKWLFIQDFGKLKIKNLPKWKKWVGRGRKTVFLFSWPIGGRG